MKNFYYLLLLIDYFFIGLVWFYKIFISPFKLKVCRFTPTCSTYMILAIKEFHFFKGIKLGLNRLSRCNNKSIGGIDLVPINIKGKSRFLL